MTVLGTAPDVGTLVATPGIAKTAGNQIVTRFDVPAATHVVATAARGTRRLARRGLPGLAGRIPGTVEALQTAL